MQAKSRHTFLGTTGGLRISWAGTLYNKLSNFMVQETFWYEIRNLVTSKIYLRFI